MKIKEIYNLAIQKGIKADFRGQEGVAKFLENKKSFIRSGFTRISRRRACL